MTNDPSKPQADDAATAAQQSYPPPVDFRLLMSSFAGQAMASLGKIANPMTGKTDVSLPWARYFIDVLVMLEEKTRGNLEKAEHSDLESSISMLQLTYVDTAKHEAAPPDGESADGEAEGA